MKQPEIAVIVSTEYIPWTNNKPARVKAVHLLSRRKLIIPFDDEVELLDSHQRAAEQLMADKELDQGGYGKWKLKYRGGMDGSGYLWVFVWRKGKRK